MTAAGIATARLDARVLAVAAIGADSRIAPDFAVAVERAALYHRMIDRRAAREPVSRILGRREFWSLDFTLSPATLDPRPDSETLVEAVLARRPGARRVLDLGTGSGCLLLALLSELPEASGVGLDRSFAAIETARANARALGLADRASFIVGSWGDALAGGGFDVVMSNPPYIRRADLAGLDPELTYDPVLALDGGDDGLDAYRALIPDLPRLVAPGGLAALEVGSDQGEAVSRVMSEAGFGVEPVIRDLAGLPRVVAGGMAPSEKLTMGK